MTEYIKQKKHKIILPIFFFLLFGNFSNAQSSQGRNQKMLPMIELENRFEKNLLNENDLKVFEERAIQKVQDFLDYLQIIGNPEFDLALRKEAIKQVKALFFNESSEIQDFFSSDKIEINSFLNQVLNAEIKIQSLPTNIISADFESNGNYYFSTFNIFHKPADGQIKENKIEIVLLKKPKKFGSETKFVWEILLNKVY